MRPLWPCAGLVSLILGVLALGVPPSAAASPPRQDGPWQETRFQTGCEPGPFNPPPAPLPAASLAPIQDAPHELVLLEVNLSDSAAGWPILGTGFNFEHALWSCPAFQPIFYERLLQPFQPAIARVDSGLLPAAPAGLTAEELGPEVYRSMLASEPYAASWDFLRALDCAGIRVALGVWGGPPQFTLDGTRLGVLDPFHATLVDFIVREQQAPVWAITIANEPDGGDGNHIPPDGLAYIARQLAMRLAPYGVKLYGPDTASAAHALEYLPGLLEDPVIADALAFVGFHQYRADPGVAVVGDYVRARRPELPVIVTEYTSFSYGALDDGQEASDELGFMLEILDTVLAHYRSGADAALYWDAVDYLQPGHDAITRWGLLRGPAEAFAPRKWYYGMSQVLPYLRPGTRLLTTSQVGGEELAVTAMRTPEDGLAIVLLNIGAGPIDLVLNLAGEGATPVNDLSVHRTDDDEDAAFVGRVSTSDDGVLVTLPGYSVTTLSTPGYTPSWLHVE